MRYISWNASAEKWRESQSGFEHEDMNVVRRELRFQEVTERAHDEYANKEGRVNGKS